MAEQSVITADYIRSILSYDPEAGEFHWTTRTQAMFSAIPERSAEHMCANWNSRFAAKIASCQFGKGYLGVVVNGRRYAAHRLAWLYMTGNWPVADIDHIDRDRANNKFANLREATRSQNLANTPHKANNLCGIKGVSFDGRRNRYRARIRVDGNECFLGYFDSLECAAAAYAKATKELHGEFAIAS